MPPPSPVLLATFGTEVPPSIPTYPIVSKATTTTATPCTTVPDALLDELRRKGFAVNKNGRMAKLDPSIQDRCNLCMICFWTHGPLNYNCFVKVLQFFCCGSNGLCYAEVESIYTQEVGTIPIGAFIEHSAATTCETVNAQLEEVTSDENATRMASSFSPGCASIHGCDMSVLAATATTVAEMEKTKAAFVHSTVDIFRMLKMCVVCTTSPDASPEPRARQATKHFNPQSTPGKTTDAPGPTTAKTTAKTIAKTITKTTAKPPPIIAKAQACRKTIRTPGKSKKENKWTGAPDSTVKVAVYRVDDWHFGELQLLHNGCRITYKDGDATEHGAVAGAVREPPACMALLPHAKSLDICLDKCSISDGLVLAARA